jgi:hypothetical protein
MREAARTCHETALRASRRRATPVLVPLSLAGDRGVPVASFGEVASTLSQQVRREAATTVRRSPIAKQKTRVKLDNWISG